ncbi:MAG: DNA replication and repair protein RecF [Bdellovibrionaceae bacterium]|nr:DNA replication and repair protein RecF [Pseudobdellovibrionaceae bacterium]
MRHLDLEIFNFRNFEKLKLEFSQGLNIFVGSNGQGKTNLLEALYLTTQGHSFRPAETPMFMRHDKEQSILRSHILNETAHNSLDFLVQLNISKSGKQYNVNDKKISSSDLKRKLACVVFSPESLAIIKSSAEERRNLVDELIVTIDPKQLQMINDFKKALKTRNKILKDFLKGQSTKKQVLDLLESINPIFLKLCITLTEMRIKAIKSIRLDFNTAMRNISKDQNVDISVEYQAFERNILDFEFTVFRDLHVQRLLELREAELSSGISLVGPHKHEILFLMNRKDSRFFCSQGQQRAIILSFKMAQIVYHRKTHGEYPVLMLDDVLSELDDQKRNALIAFLHDVKTQIFITSTDLNLSDSFRLEGSSVIGIERGQILNLKN